MNFRLEHIAVWADDLDKMKNFYQTYFNAKSSDLYHNQKTGFKSYFLRFNDKCRIEIMNRADIKKREGNYSLGYAHIAFSVGGREKVDLLTEKLRADGFKINSEPRTTGDGYYESSVLDPENNIIEITE